MNKAKTLKKLNKQKLEAWRIAVKAKFNNKCAMCGRTDYLDCHHILSFRLYKEFRYEVNNSILLCKKHHRFSKGSPHQDSIIFANWLQNNHALIFNWIIRNSQIANTYDIQKNKNMPSMQ